MATKSKLLQAAAGTAAASGGAGGAVNVEDVFATHIYEGSDGYKVIENGISLGESGVGGSAEFNNNNTLIVADSTDFHFGGGDWTVEAFCYAYRGTDDFVIAGWGEDSDNRFDFGWQSSAAPRIRVGQNAVTYEATASSSFALSNYAGSWVHVACVRYNNVLTLWIDGVEACSVSYSVADFPQPSTGGVGIGSRWHTGRTGLTNEGLGHISNFRIVKGTGIYTSAFTAPTSELTAITNTTLLCLQGSDPLTDVSGNSHSITQSSFNATSNYTEHLDVVASSFGPFDTNTTSDGGMVWTKDRVNGGSSTYHHIMDTDATGFSKTLWPNDTSALYSSYGASAWHSNGYTVNMSGSSGLSNILGSYVSWTWKKAPRFFDIQTWTGNGASTQTISHNLGSVPGAIFVKRTDAADNWAVFHRGFDTTSPSSYYARLDENGDVLSTTSRFGGVNPTSTQFTVGNDASVNASNGTYVAYIFAHNDGDGGWGVDADQDIIKCGSFQDGQNNNTVNLGFEPQWVLIKRIDVDSVNSNAGARSSRNHWMIADIMRYMPVTIQVDGLAANLSDAETEDDFYIKPTATGFIHDSTSYDGTGEFVYIAVRKGPMAIPTDADTVFALNRDQTNVPMIYAGFPPDFSILALEDGSNDRFLSSRITGKQFFRVNSTASAGSQAQFQMEFDGAYSWSPNISTYQGWMWKRAPSFADFVTYTGNGTTGHSIAHNLGVAPEMVWIKRSDATGYAFYVYVDGQSNGALLDGTGSFNQSQHVTGTSSTTITLNNDAYVNASAGEYRAVLFATADGVSKVGSYTGVSGSTIDVDCGFSSGARWVLIKRTDSTSPWWVWNSLLGIQSGIEFFFDLNSNAQPTENLDWLDPYSGGFKVRAGGNNNVNGASYIFYAIA